ncbi:MAG: DsrE family protein [Chloroflexi bacterium]|nr:DsrE family protein [Chloroflexota bacterium]MBI3733968.1 DsrE family protein [Chloroflexota bacterium]
MQSVLVWINSAPAHPNLGRAFQLALQLRAQGRAVSVFLAQDAVLAGIKAEGDAPIAQALQAAITTYALAEDLRLRGFSPASLWDGVRLADYTQLLELFDQHERVIGAL